jgi:hypothetical protein
LHCIKSSRFFPLPPTLALFVSLSPIVSLSQSYPPPPVVVVVVAAAEVFCRKLRSPLNPTTHPPATNQQFGNFHKGIVVVFVFVFVGLFVCLFVVVVVVVFSFFFCCLLLILVKEKSNKGR